MPLSQKIDIRKAAQISGLSVAWWRQRVFRKEVPFYKVGRRVLFDPDDIARLLNRCRVEPQEAEGRRFARA